MLQKLAAAEKRRLKHCCFACGQLGHVQRLCPGRSGDGEDQSKYSCPKGQRKQNKKAKDETQDNSDLELPEGFEPLVDQGQSNANALENGEATNIYKTKAVNFFLYYDAGCNSLETIEYIRQGRGKSRISNKEAIEEHQHALEKAAEYSNYGGRISRSLIRPGHPWSRSCAFSIEGDNNMLWFVIGLHRDFLYNDRETEAALASLAETYSENDDIVGFFADINFSPEATSLCGLDRDSQCRRLICTCQAAQKAGATIQIRLQPAAAHSRSATDPNDTDPTASCYLHVMKDFVAILEEMLAKYPALKVHLACWVGEADHMTVLLRKFPNNIWIGMDASVTFAKVTRAHECAFEIPLSKLLLETGTPTTIPSTISRSKGREAFCHSGYIPLIAAAIARLKKKLANVTAAEVARSSSNNTISLYPRIVARNS